MHPYVTAHEDTLEVQPPLLQLEPQLEHLGDGVHGRLPFLHGVEERADELGRGHRVHVHHVVLQNLIHLVRRTQDESTILDAWGKKGTRFLELFLEIFFSLSRFIITLVMFDHGEFQHFPHLGQVFQTLLNGQLFHGVHHDLLGYVLVLPQLHGEHVLKGEPIDRNV